MKRTYIQPQATSICLFTEDTLLNNSVNNSVVLSDETNDTDANQWSQERNDNGGIWQYMNDND